jgi:hypothetical protein
VSEMTNLWKALTIRADLTGGGIREGICQQWPQGGTHRAHIPTESSAQLRELRTGGFSWFQGDLIPKEYPGLIWTEDWFMKEQQRGSKEMQNKFPQIFKSPYPSPINSPTPLLMKW